MKIDGKQMAQQLLQKLKLEVDELKIKGITLTLAVILMGDNESSAAYVRQKELKAEEIGAEVKVFQLAQNVSNDEIESLIKKLDSDPKIHGIILQRPTPPQIEADRLEEFISPEKEVDGFGDNPRYPVPVAEAVYRMITSVLPENELKTKKIAVLGKGETAGGPIIKFLLRLGIQPLIVDSQTKNKEGLIKTADIIISAVGKEKVLNAEDIKKGAIVIGVGLTTSADGKLKGDFENEEIEKVASYYSPTPGGVGPLNVAILMENLAKAVQATATS